MLTNMTAKLPFALAALILIGPSGAVAQDKDPKLVSCAELMAMDAEAQRKFLESLVAASANALDLNDLVASGAPVGPMRDLCAGNPDMMAMDAAMSVQN
jgi:hypothetical protein